MSYETQNQTANPTYQPMTTSSGGSLGNVNRATEVQPRAPIDSGLTALQDRIEDLHKLASELDRRLSPVLRSAPPGVPTPRPIELVAGSPIGGLLADRIAQLRDLEARLDDILTRCEL